jgi:exodeoxyribonuclease VII small subunit
LKEDSKDFELKLENIKQMLDKLTNPEISLKESVELYKNGMKEIALAQKLLDDAKCEFETLSKD